MTVMGELGEFDVATLLQVLVLRRATGRLTVATDTDDVGLYVAAGQLVLVTSNRLPLRLGRVLLQRGLISVRQLHQVLRDQEADGRDRSLGGLLVDRGWITAEHLAGCVEEQSVAALSRVLAAGQGRFHYASGVRAPNRVEATPLDARRVLTEAAKRVEELGRLRGLLPPPHAPLAPSSQLDVMVVALNDQERAVVAALEAGASCLAELRDLLPVDEPALLRTVLGMRSRGLLVAGRGAPGDDAGAAAAPPPSEHDLARLLDAGT